MTRVPRRYWLFTSTLLAIAVIAGCTASSGPILMYDPSKYTKDQVAVLLPATDRGIHMVLEINGTKAGGSCFTNCMFMQPVHIPPGLHRFKTSNMRGPEGTSLLYALTFDFEAEVEAGKVYEFRIKPVDTERGEFPEYRVWWEEVDSQP